jgi:signal transduction histidine kinase
MRLLRHKSIEPMRQPNMVWRETLLQDNRLTALESRLAKAHLLESILDGFPGTCILLVSHSGTVLSVHGEAQDLLGTPAQQLLGRRLHSYESAHHLGISTLRLHRVLVRARRRGRARLEATIHGATAVDVHLTLIDLGNHFACVLADRSEMHAMQRALLRRNSELQMAAERLKEIDILKNEFLSNVSHELRTPLTAIIAYTEALLLSQPDAATLTKFLQVIADQSHKLQQLIHGLLDISKLDSLATELKLHRASLNEVVRAAVVTVHPTAETKSIRIETDLANDLPDVFLDELRSQQIVWNLLNNAIKFSPEGSAVVIRTWSGGDSVWCSVTDQGAGIAVEHQQLIFQKFVQIDGSTTRKQGGVGLGLDLVQRLLALHGGTIGVDSQPGQGACFTFSIPIEKRSKQRLDERPATILGAPASRSEAP